MRYYSFVVGRGTATHATEHAAKAAMMRDRAYFRKLSGGPAPHGEYGTVHESGLRPTRFARGNPGTYTVRVVHIGTRTGTRTRYQVLARGYLQDTFGSRAAANAEIRRSLAMDAQLRLLNEAELRLAMEDGAEQLRLQREAEGRRNPRKGHSRKRRYGKWRASGHAARIRSQRKAHKAQFKRLALA